MLSGWEHCRAMRLLPFAAATDKPHLTLKCQVTLPAILIYVIERHGGR
jgi:hypothetical protein